MKKELPRQLSVFPYNVASESANRIAVGLTQALTKIAGSDYPVRRIRHEGSKFRGTAGKMVLNWGAANLPEDVDAGATILNRPERVAVAVNKRDFFDMMTRSGLGEIIPEYSIGMSDKVEEWSKTGRSVKDPTYPFALIRTMLRANSGEGIVEVNQTTGTGIIKPGQLVVRYVPKKAEYRVHVNDKGNIYFLQKKVRRNDVEKPNWVIRNHANGFNFAHGPEYVEDVPEQVTRVARMALEASGLNFAAVDVIYNAASERAYVLEMNSAPGIEGGTRQAYIDMLVNDYIVGK